MNIFNSLGSNYTLTYCFKSLSITNNSDVEKLKEFVAKKYVGEVMLFYKGREALTTALEILELPRDSEVVINGFTCVAVFNAIHKAGYEPVCLDLEQTGGLNFTSEILEKTVAKNKKIKAVVVQNTLGYPCDIEKIETICKKNNLILIEDLAHCVGTKYADGREAGTVGDFVCLSFSQDKIIDGISGGALVARNQMFRLHHVRQKKISMYLNVKDRLYPFFTYKIRWLYRFRLGKLYHFFLKRLGLMSNIMDESFYNSYELPSINAKLALIQYKNLKKQLLHRQHIAEIYLDKLPANLFMFDRKKTKAAVVHSTNLRFPIFLNNRDELTNYLKRHKVFLSDIWYKDVAPDCPNAIADSRIILNLPTHRGVSQKDAQQIARRINLWLNSQ